MTADPQRPRYHFLPPTNWMNDPNGLIQWGDTFHLFYQYNPAGAYHRQIHWGHATSHDLVHWQHQPLALAPTPGGADADGCWSGCAVDDHGTPTLIYTGFRLPDEQKPCLAVSYDGLQTWQKWPTPIISRPPPNLDLLGFRDHTVWYEHGLWHMLIGSGIRNQGGTVLLYRSPDLRHWKYDGPLLVGDATQFHPIWTGLFWECPDFFTLGHRQVLVCSVWDQRPYYTIAMIGDYQHGRFTPYITHKLDYGDTHFYAPQTMPIRDGRRLMFGWMMEGRREAAILEAGWAGVMTLPREVRFTDDGQVVTLPVCEIQQLRQREVHVPPHRVMPNELHWMPIRGAQLEIELTLYPPQRGTCSILLRANPDGSEATVLRYNHQTATLTLDRRRSSLTSDVWRDNHHAPLTLKEDEPLTLRIFLDASVVEVFANNRRSITSRIYPVHPDSLGIAITTKTDPLDVLSFRAWQMDDIW